MIMSIRLTRFPISGLGKPKLYQNMWCFTRMWGFYLVSWSGRESILPWNKVTIPFISNSLPYLLWKYELYYLIPKR